MTHPAAALDVTELWQSEALAHPEIEPLTALWMAVLTQLVKDGRSAWLKTRAFGAEAGELQSAMHDLLTCGEMTRHVCAMTGYDPVWLSEQFRRWCSVTPRDKRLAPKLTKY